MNTGLDQYMDIFKDAGKFIVRFMLNYRVKTVLINKKRSSLRLYRLSFVYLRYAARYALKSSHGRTRQ